MDNTEPATAIRVTDLAYAYDGDLAVKVDAFTLDAGASCAVLGPSGCGKSTFVHLLAGLLTPQQGAIHVLGEELAAMTESERDRFRGHSIGFVFQQFHLLPALSVTDNLLLAQKLSGNRGPLPAIPELLESLGLGALAKRKPRELSHGQAQRVAIARSVCHQPKLVIADEPTSALDDKHAHDALSLLKQVTQSQGAALLVVTHDQRVRGQVESEFALGVPA